MLANESILLHIPEARSAAAVEVAVAVAMVVEVVCIFHCSSVLLVLPSGLFYILGLCLRMASPLLHTSLSPHSRGLCSWSETRTADC